MSARKPPQALDLPPDPARIDAVLARYPAPLPRHLALPLLQELQRALGWLGPATLTYVSRRTGLPLAHLQGLVTFYDLLAPDPQGRWVLRVCDDVACSLGGRAQALLAALERHLGLRAGETSPDGRFTLRTAPCLGGCDRGPCLLVGPDHVFVGPVDPAQVPALLRGLAAGGEAGLPAPPPIRHGTYPGWEPVLLARCGRVDPCSLDAYLAHDGFAALRRALAMDPEAVIAQVTAARLLGRGGAAFPCGRKWAAARRAPGTPKYVVLNADESEPGTFTNRKLLEEDPFALVEAMVIAAHAVGARHGYAYIRGEYDLAARRFAAAVAACRRAGFLGRNILGSGLDFDIEVRLGAGAYVCGEETALLESIEGKRGEPRNKPPFPVEAGLFGKPTVVNNVETLACVIPILLRGPQWFTGAGAGGPKLFSVAGDVHAPGVYEVPLGISLGELVACAGGVRGELQAVLLGGAAGVFLPPSYLDLRLDYDHVRRAGLSLGAGAVLVFNRDRDLWQVARRVARFFAEESCGKCVPCRLGTARQLELVDLIAAGEETGEEVLLLADLAAVMGDASICGLGQTATWPIQTLLRYFGTPRAGRPGPAAPQAIPGAPQGCAAGLQGAAGDPQGPASALQGPATGESGDLSGEVRP